MILCIEPLVDPDIRLGGVTDPDIQPGSHFSLFISPSIQTIRTGSGILSFWCPSPFPFVFHIPGLFHSLFFICHWISLVFLLYDRCIILCTHRLTLHLLTFRWVSRLWTDSVSQYLTFISSLHGGTTVYTTQTYSTLVYAWICSTAQNWMGTMAGFGPLWIRHCIKLQHNRRYSTVLLQIHKPRSTTQSMSFVYVGSLVCACVWNDLALSPSKFQRHPTIFLFAGLKTPAEGTADLSGAIQIFGGITLQLKFQDAPYTVRKCIFNKRGNRELQSQSMCLDNHPPVPMHCIQAM